MQKYRHSRGDSGVAAYKCGPDFIDVKFHSGGTFRYSYQSAGRQHIENMKALAAQGEGLNTYINQHTRELFQR